MSGSEIELPMLPSPEKDPSWRGQARCLGSDTNKFFRERGHSGYYEERIMCALCPVQTPCLDFALEYHIRDGFYGGFTREERKKIANGSMTREITMTQIVSALRKITDKNAIREASRLFLRSEDEIKQLIAQGK